MITVPTRPQNSRQRMPVAPVAGQPRGLHRHHCADAALADGGKQPLEARPSGAASGSAEVVVDHLDIVPPQLAGAVRQAVLPSLALQVMGDLHGRRLTYVNEGAARQMVRRDLRHHSPPIAPGRRRWPAVSPSPASAAPAADPPTSSAPPAASTIRGGGVSNKSGCGNIRRIAIDASLIGGLFPRLRG